MDFLYSDDPIVACSTNNDSNSAIAVIRFSGFKNLECFSNFLDININSIKPRYAHFCKIIHENSVYDETILTYFEAPHSYNGENIMELSVHGNTLNVDRIIDLFIQNSGFRHAKPGEFSYRALKNKKLTLSQVEGLDLFLNANSSFILQQGFSLLSGKLQNSYLQLHSAYLAHKSAVELSIDFLEDIGEQNAQSRFAETLSDLIKIVSKLKAHVENASQHLVNPEITLVGLPNSGKSSLFNLLLHDNRAIVSNIAGTTRDYISETIRIENIFYRLTDTAGIRKTQNYVESEGIKKSLELIKSSFFKILLINPFEFDISFFEQLKSIQFDLIVFSHCDLPNFLEQSHKAVSSLKKTGFEIIGPIEPLSASGPIEPLINFGPIGADLTSENNRLNHVIFQTVNKKYLDSTKSEPITIERHVDIINKIYLLLCDYKNLAQSETDISIISSELNSLGHCISELIGIISADDVLQNIFSNFCIGK